jgi:hypothetical protein
MVNMSITRKIKMEFVPKCLVITAKRAAEIKIRRKIRKFE